MKVRSSRSGCPLHSDCVTFATVIHSLNMIFSKMHTHAHTGLSCWSGVSWNCVHKVQAKDLLLSDRSPVIDHTRFTLQVSKSVVLIPLHTYTHTHTYTDTHRHTRTQKKTCLSFMWCKWITSSLVAPLPLPSLASEEQSLFICSPVRPTRHVNMPANTKVATPSHQPLYHAGKVWLSVKMTPHSLFLFFFFFVALNYIYGFRLEQFPLRSFKVKAHNKVFVFLQTIVIMFWSRFTESVIQ